MIKKRIPDVFEYKENQYQIRTHLLLRPYFEKYPERKINQKHIVYLELIEENLELKDFQCLSRENEYESKLNDAFPKKENRTIKWFNGIFLLSPQDLKGYQTLSKLDENKSYYILEFKNGILNKEVFLESGELNMFREKQFFMFKQTKQYLEIKEKLIPFLQKTNGKSKDEIEEDFKKAIVFLTKKIL